MDKTVVFTKRLIILRIYRYIHYTYSIPFEDIELDMRFEVELGVDSREMFELILALEEMFYIKVDLDEIDDFIFNKNTRKITVQDTIDYVIHKILEKNLNEVTDIFKYH